MSGGGAASSENIRRVLNEAKSEIHSCGECGKEGVTLCCKACVSIYYCGRDCQKAHWKMHKPLCKVTSAIKDDVLAKKKQDAELGDGFVEWVSAILARRLEESSKARENRWHEGISHEEAYVRLIDSFRLRRDDEYTFSVEICEFYGGGRPMPGFRRYLKQAEKNKILPSWWSTEHDTKVKHMALTHEWANLNYAVEKSDVVEHYGKLSKPFEHWTLRGLAEQIAGPLDAY